MADADEGTRLAFGLWFTLRSLAVRGRFLTGKASFVRAQVRQAAGTPADIRDGKCRKLGARPAAHHDLDTEPPRTGTQGWTLFCQAALARPPAPLERLECGYCGHLYFLDISGATPAGEDAAYDADWFSFSSPSRLGEPSLSCPHCEQAQTPRVRFIREP